MPEPEVWLRGPIAGVPLLLQPVAHALEQVREDAAAMLRGLDQARLWARPAGAASAGFHLLHLAGALDRLFTYARGEALDDAQRAALRAEASPEPAMEAGALLDLLNTTLDRALAQVRATDPARLLDDRRVGRAGLPSTLLGLLFHAAEHSTRHAGQAVTTLKLAGAPPA
jgi:uncharacterized damage-inducible protein DinB